MIVNGVKYIAIIAIELTKTLLEERPICRDEEFLVAGPLGSSKVHLDVARGRTGMKAMSSGNEVDSTKFNSYLMMFKRLP